MPLGERFGQWQYRHTCCRYRHLPMKRIALILTEDFYATGVTATLDLLQLANGLLGPDSAPLFDWRLYSQDGQPRTASNGLPIAVAGDFAALDQADALVLPAIRYQELSQLQRRLDSEPQIGALIRRCHATGTLVCANCTGVSWLAHSGLLDGRQATISWWLIDWLRQRYPLVRLQPYAVVAEQDGVISSGAASAHYNLTLRLIERLGGSDLAIRCAQRALVDRHRPSQAPYADFQQFVGHHDPLIARAQQWLQQQMAQPFVLAALADALATSERTLMRRFRQTLGASPLQYLQRLRMQAARRLLECSTLEIKQIAAEVGYGDVSSFRRLFKRELSCAPGYYRRATRDQMKASDRGENGIQRQS